MQAANKRNAKTASWKTKQRLGCVWHLLHKKFAARFVCLQLFLSTRNFFFFAFSLRLFVEEIFFDHLQKHCTAFDDVYGVCSAMHIFHARLCSDFFFRFAWMSMHAVPRSRRIVTMVCFRFIFLYFIFYVCYYLLLRCLHSMAIEKWFSSRAHTLHMAGTFNINNKIFARSAWQAQRSREKVASDARSSWSWLKYHSLVSLTTTFWEWEIRSSR